MKKNTLQKTFAVALTGAMVMGTLAGCSSSTTETTTTDTAETATETATTEAAAEATEATEAAAETDAVAGMEGWEPFADTVTIQIPVYDRGDAGNGCSDVENNYWTNWVQENFGDAYNIKVEYVGITRSDVMTDYAMLAAGQDLPTICMEYDYDKLATWQADGYLQPYDVETFKTIAPTYWAAMEENGLTAYTQLDGEDYLLLGKRPYGNTNYTFVTFYREDWLKEAGYDEYPSTTSELLELYAKLVENGHEYPLSGSKVSGAGADQNYGWRDYPQDETTWATTGDYQIPALSTEAQKRFLKFQNELYNDGYLNPEYYLRDASEVEADFINGKAFTWSGYVSSTMNVLNSFYEANPDADLGVCVCSDQWIQDETWGSSNSFRPNNVFGAMVAFANDATEDEMKAAMMYMEWMSQEENLFTMTWGIEGVNYTVGEDGNPVAVADQTGLEEQQGHNNNVDYWMIVTASKSFGSIEEDIAAIAPQGLPEDFYDDLLANYKGQLALYESGYANVDCLFASSLESVTEYGTELKESVYPELRDQLVMCAPEEFDALYDELSQKYLDAGYQEVIDERQSLFDEGLTTRLQ
ncbi:MAG: extracellular solute-binding protein [Butyrivibrio sp.]|jgi:putative aldouronate transport system substrate-binding protein|nr:extracellular solute-binding protein [Butyrivibrio sp.]